MKISWCKNNLVARILSSKEYFSPALKWSACHFTACVKVFLVCFTVFTGTIFTSTPSIADQELITTGISGTEDDDDINNTAPVDAEAVIDTSLSETVQTSATGIDALGGDDLIQNSASISSGASSTADVDEATDRTVMEASGVGVTGGAGADDILNTADIDITAGAQALTLDAVLPIIGDGVVDISTMAVTNSTGITGDTDADFIDNTGQVDLVSTSDSTAAGISLTIDGIVAGDGSARVLGDASATADAQAVGIAGGDDVDRIDNKASVFVDLFATATTVNVGALIEVTEDAIVSGATLSDSSALAVAWATGLSGGSGADTLYSDGDIVFLANADATSVGVTLTIAGTAKGDATGTALTDTRAIAGVATIGIAGRAGNDLIDNRSSILAEARATSTGVGVGTEVGLVVEEGGNVSGTALSDARVMATSTATGIDGGEGDDTIDNEGIITLMNGIGDDETDASATAVSVALTVSGSMEGNVAGEAMSDSSATADAMAIGIDGGSGLDGITNRGAIVGNVDSSATAVGVAVDIGITEGGDVLGAALSNASVTANAIAAGITGGEGDDTIDNEGLYNLVSDAQGDSVAASVTIAGTVIKKDIATADVKATALSDASSTAEAITVGLDGGEGNDEISNMGNLELLKAEAESDAVAVSLGIDVVVTTKGASKVDIEGAALSDASATALAVVAGLDAGDGDDMLVNEGDLLGLETYAKSNSDAVAVDIAGNVVSKGASAGDVKGEAVSDASSTAEAFTVGVNGGEGNDTITNRGDLELLKAEAESDAFSLSVGAQFAVTTKGGSLVDIEGAALSDASATALAVVAGLDAGDGNDMLVNEGDLLGLETYAKSNSDAVAIELAGNVTIKGAATGDVKGEAVSDASSTAEAFTVGLDGGEGNDTITNRGDLELLKAKAESDADTVAASVTVSVPIKGVSFVDVEGASLSNSSASAEAIVTGLDAGYGDDKVMSEGDIIKLEAEADADSLAVSVTIAGTVGGDAKGLALSEASAMADATVAGISGGEGNDMLENQAKIDATSSSVSEATAASAEVSVQVAGGGESTGAALSDSSATANATATGIDGGEGNDEIDNEGELVTLADADADSLAVSVAIGVGSNGVFGGEVESEAASDAGATAEATAGGIVAGAGDDMLDNSGKISADVYSNATSKSVSADVAVQASVDGTSSGAALSDSSATALAVATGIDGGVGNDMIFNEGVITLMEQHDWNADSDALAVGVSIGFAGALSEASGLALSNSSAMSDAGAIGIAGGEGDDTIDNWAAISADVGSRAEATSASASLAVSMQGGSATAASLADASATGLATATGINGGGGVDSIVNNADITMKSRSEAEAEAVSVSFSVAPGGVSATSAMADSSSSAVSESTGLQGESGADDIDSGTNLGDSEIDPSLLKITTDSQATATASSITVSGSASVGLSDGASVADSSASSEASSTGIDGGLGNDTIDNAIEIEATSQADATANSTSVTLGVSVGASGSASLGDASATAHANATGIEGGEDDDTIVNTAAITAGSASENPGPMAQAQADSTTVDVGISVGYSNREASANSSAFAVANAAGISGGSGDDWIENTGDISIVPSSLGTGSMAAASGSSDAVSVGLTVGESLGASSSDTSSTAVASLAGIRGGSGNDTVYNSGTIITGIDPDDPGMTDAMATARAASETVSVTIGIGDSLSDASSNASATAQSSSIGIETGAGHDRIENENTGVINAFSSSRAWGLGKTTSVSLTVGASDSSAKSDASSLSTALATGIDSGGDADEIITDSDVVVKARAISTASSDAENDNILSLGSAVQSAEANSSSTAKAVARGIDGGTGADIITVAGNYDVSADTLVESTSRSSTLTGFSAGENEQEAQSRAGTVSDALAIGIDGGEGSDTITSTATLTVNTFSNADTEATSASSTGFNIVGSSSAESVSGATSDVTASGIGIRGGTSVFDVDDSDVDVITNEGVINVTTTVSAVTDSTSTADSITFIGKAEGAAMSDASATVLADGIGIDGGADNDSITSKNTISVTTTANVAITSTSNADSYATFGGAYSRGASDASAEVLTEATGISGGTGDDIISSHALVEVGAKSIGSVTATSNVNADVTFGGASSEAASDTSVTKKGSATGIDGGDGSDEIANYNTLNVKAEVAGAVTSKANADADATFGSTSSITTTAAALEGAVDTKGIIGGSGGDRITNLGRVDSIADATLFVANSSVATAESTFGSSDARAFSVSTLQGKASSLGVSGDDGDDFIENAGAVNVKAIANATVNSATVAIAESFWGSEYTEAASSNYAAGASTAEGITAGAGNDGILNTELITVEASGEVKITSEVYSSAGPASSDARTMALSHASGIDSGADDDNVLNTGTVFVKAAPRVISATRTFGMRGHTDGKVGIEFTANATGISGSAGIDTITNEGDILVFLGSPESESTVSEDATSGAITFTDNKRTGEDPEAIVGKWVRIQVSDGRNFVTSIDAFDPETGTFTLHDPIKYDLVVNDGYTLYDYGDKTPDIVSVQVTAGGRTQVDASTTASVRAQGITGGEGDDQLSNSGTVAVSASNRIKAVTVTIARNIVADTRVESSVNAVGIAGNDQSDTSDRSSGGASVFTDLSRKGDDPDAIIGQQVYFESGASAGFTSLVNGFDPDTGTFTLADPLPAGGLTRGDNYTLGGGSDLISNLGAIDVAANGAINASGWSLAFGAADIQAGGRAQAAAAGIQGGGFIGDFLENKDYIKTRSNAEVTSIERVIATFGTVEQKLGFSSSSNAAGMLAGSGDDSIMNSAQAVTDVNAASTTSIQGVTSSTNIFSIGQQTVNLVDALAEARATGVELGAGENIASNDGVLIVHASAVPATLGGLGADECAPYTCLAKAVSDNIYDPIFNIFYDESSASANATATAIAHGIHGEGKDQVFNNGKIQVSSEVIATSFAQASEVIPAEDQSTVAALIPGDKDQFRDKSVQGISATELVGRRLRFPEHPDLDFLNNVSSISEVTGSNTFEDSTFIGVGDPENLIGNRVRFPVLNNPDFLTFVEAFDSTTGEFVLADDIPTDSNGNPLVMNGDAYTLSILSTEVLAFDPETGKFTLGNDIPGEVSKGNAYTLSIVSAEVPSGSTTFTDVTRTDSVAAGTRITFTGIPGFEAFVVGFDPSTGTFLLDRAITATLPKDEVYELSGDSDGSSGSSASAFTTGIDLGNGDAQVENSGVIKVTATATAQAGVEALLGNENASAVSIAEARGIRTRDGNDWIMNSGKIDVHADVAAQSSTVDFSGRALVIGIDSGAGSDTVINTGEIKVTGMVEAADAIIEVIGADTGDGDDIVLNAGTGSVSASTTIAGITTTATAISTGVGQDQVSLLDQSGITGRIDLGPGDDLLTLAGGATVAGAVTGSEGSDTVRLEDRGSFFLPELQENEHYQVDQGTLEVGADMAIPADGSFRAEIYNPGVAEPGFGQLVVDGVANLGGVANVSALPRIFTAGEDFPLLMAGQFNNGFPAFDTVNLPPDSALVKFGYDYRFDVAGRDLFEVTTAVEPFRTVARNSLQRTVAGHLERIAPTASGDLAEVIGTFQLLPQNANFDTAFTSLSPDTHDNYTQATFFGVSQYQETLSRRLRARRIDRVLGGTSSRQAGFETDRSLLLAYSGDNSGIRSLYAGEVTEVPAWWRDVWVTAFGQWGDQDGEDGYTGFDYNVMGLSVGIDRPVNDRLLLGASAAYTDTDVDQENGRGDGDIEGWMASLYSSYSLDSAYVDATLSYGQNDYDAKRKIRIGDLTRSAKSDHDGDVIAASLGGGYLVSRDSVVLEPFGRLQYIKLDEDSFTESGAGDINQRISSRDTDSLTSEIGMRISRSFPHTSGRLTTDASVAWLHDFDIDDRTITTSYTGAPTSSFSLPGQDVESNGVTLGLGVAFETKKRVSTSLNYNGEFRDGFSAHGISGRISYRF